MKLEAVKKVATVQLGKLEEVRALTQLFPHAQRLEDLFKRWNGIEPSLLLLESSHQLLLNVHLDFIKDIEPMLEFLEIGLDINFDKTKDVTTFGTYRVFTAADCPWLRVDANLKADGPGCHRVITGYSKPEPIYEIRCLAEIDAPLAIEGSAPEQLPAPAPALPGPFDDDIPF